MRRITMWLVSTVAAVVLLFSYRTSTSGPAATTGPRVAGGAQAPGIVSGGGAAGVTPDPSGSRGSASGQTVVNGSVAQTRWGPVQVQVMISGGRIVDVVALQVPNGNVRDQEINSYAVPQLHDEVLQAQSAEIDSISGATVTSGGYIESLQAALDAAHFNR
jgi:FMN-binding domain